ncbi:hypothetical protein ACQPXS_46090 [Streptomyces sp. CA-142005]|uniref:hypothetical protein n=1 Tax=Streptomyces sp. CA-142005 TaxID=3240052 RepID=UPI003D93C4AC
MLPEVTSLDGQHFAVRGEAEAGRLQAVGGQDGGEVVPGDQGAGVGESGRDVAVVAVEHLGQELVPAQVSRHVQRRQRVSSWISRCCAAGAAAVGRGDAALTGGLEPATSLDQARPDRVGRRGGGGAVRHWFLLG